MKKFTYLMIVVVCLVFVSCDKSDEVPPRAEGITTTFELPRATPLTPAEREIIKAKREEYNNSVL